MNNPTDQGKDFLFRMHIDVPLLSGLLALAIVSLTVLYAASGQDMAMVQKQGIRTLLAFTAMFFLAQFPPSFYKRWAPPIFFFGVLLLLCVLLFGVTGKGAQRWLNLAFFKFQPSEILKLITPVMVAAYLSQHRLPPKFRHLFIAIAMVFVPSYLIAKQPDLGTSILIAASGLFVIFFAGIHWRLITVAFVGISAFIPIFWYLFMHDYQRQRVVTFLNPESDPLGAGYQIIQSKIAIGSGGLLGKGWLQGTQSQLEFLPERHTDFIFAVFSEEFGFIGITVLLLLYLYVVCRGLYIATQAQGSFERLLAGAITLTFFVYIFVNIGMVSGLLPVVGVPLPLVSYGGTSMVTLMAGFGIIMSIHTHRRLISQ